MKTKLFLLPLLALLFAACDSNDEDPSNREILIGNHTAVAIADNTGDQTAAFQQIVQAFNVGINQNNTYTLGIDYNAAAEAAGRTDVNLAGTYTLNETAKTFTMMVPVSATATVPVTFNYEILASNRVRFTTNANLFNSILGTNYQGNLIVTVQKQ